MVHFRAGIGPRNRENRAPPVRPTRANAVSKPAKPAGFGKTDFFRAEPLKAVLVNVIYPTYQRSSRSVVREMGLFDRPAFGRVREKPVRFSVSFPFPWRFA
jgi:hypothetical protein